MLAGWRILFALALAATAYATLSPLVASPPVQSGDKLAHLLIFGADALIGMMAFRTPGQRTAILLGLVVFGALLEVGQGWIPYRQPSFADAVANTAGVAIAAAIVRSGAGRRH